MGVDDAVEPVEAGGGPFCRMKLYRTTKLRDDHKYLSISIPSELVLSTHIKDQMSPSLFAAITLILTLACNGYSLTRNSNLTSTFQAPQTWSQNLTRPLRLFTDFDKTLTTQDTLSALSQLQKAPSKPWSYFADTYFEDLQTLLPPLPTPGPQSLNNRTTLKQEVEYLQSYLPLERRSIERLERERYFAGFTAAKLRKHGFECAITGAVGISDGWWEMLAFLTTHNINHTVAIISLNWSAEFIAGVLSGSYYLWCSQQKFTLTGSQNLIDVISIYSNDFLLSPETNLTTGNFSRRYPSPVNSGIWTAEDKLDVMSGFVNNTAQDTVALTIYIGDSPPDLLCLLEADVGIVVGRNKELVKTCARLGLPVEEGLHGANVRGGMGDRGWRLFRRSEEHTSELQSRP